MKLLRPNKGSRVFFLLVLGFSVSGGAEPVPASNLAEVCGEEVGTLDKHRYLRAVSLDLTGAPPTLAQQDALALLDDVPEAWITEMLESDGFVDRFIRLHRSLLWNNIANVTLLNAGARLRLNPQGNFRTNGTRNTLYRGASVECLDEPLAFDENGAIATTDVDGVTQEGRRDVVPFWDDGASVSVCGFNAQENLVSVTGTDCAAPEGRQDPGCGCGPNLRWCGRGVDTAAVLASFRLSVEKTLEHLLREGRPYTEIFTTRLTYVNGPIVHYWRHWTGMSSGVRNLPRPLALSALPELPFSAMDTWVPVTLPAVHAGVLTSPAYLLRFQTHRGRASQFYTTFLCKPFQPPSGPLPVADEAALNEPDLQRRAGCKYCHALLEPAAAYWGRWPQSGAGYLDSESYPDTSAECLLCATTGASCPDDCSRFYHTVSIGGDDEGFLGQLESLLFLRPEHRSHVEEGPGLLAMKSFATNELPACAVQTAAERLLGRALRAEETPLLEDWIRAFSASGYRYRALVKAIVRSDLYRRVQ